MSTTTRTSSASRAVLVCLALLLSVTVTPRVDAATQEDPLTVPVTPAGGSDPSAVAPATAGSMCDHSYSGLVPHNSLADVRAGYYTGPPFARHQVAVDGDVDWTLDPYQSLTWRMWLDTLGWAGPLILSYDRTGNRADLALAMRYARDYVRDQPMDGNTPDVPVLQQSSRRLQFFACLYERDPQQWLVDAMEGTVAFLERNWAGYNNHGVDQDHAIVLAGCVLERDGWIELGRRRLSLVLPVSIDAEGATNEQSAAYTLYTHYRWVAAQTTMSRCGLPPLPGLAERIQSNYTFAAHATRPDGIFTPIGNTYPTDRGPTPLPGTPLSGVWVQNGWAFGRSSWAPQDDPSHFSLRFGPGRQIHGHADHGSVTLYANGTPVITEPGSIGYSDARRHWFSTAHAKNVLTIGDNTCAVRSNATLLASSRTPSADRYVVRTPHCGSLVARRGVTYTRATGTLTVDDTTTPLTKAKPRQQLWHLVPGTTSSVQRVDTFQTVVRLTMPNGSTAELVTSSVRRGASARAAAALLAAQGRLATAQRALGRAVRTKARPTTVKTRKRALVKARAEVTTTARKAAQLEDRGALSVTVVTGRTHPFQGWVSGGSGVAVPAPVVVVAQTSKAANIVTTITPG